MALGSAQFGLPYGVTNPHGQVARAEVGRILAAAWNGGIEWIDTASAYGSSESVLGTELGLPGAPPWRTITKTAALRKEAIDASDMAAVASAFATSLTLLGTERVDALLVHHAQDLLVPGGEALYEWLCVQKQSGRAGRIGASVYDSTQTSRLLERFALDVVQLPASLADQRMLQDGTVAALRQAGVEVHVRSLYLQGLLLAEPAFVAARFPQQSQWAAALRAECKRVGLSPVEACISFFRSQTAFCTAVIGATCVAEVDALVAAWSTAPAMDWSTWAVPDIAFVDPREWKAP